MGPGPGYLSTSETVIFPHPGVGKGNVDGINVWEAREASRRVEGHFCSKPSETSRK